jgi:hypothetical protein
MAEEAARLMENRKQRKTEEEAWDKIHSSKSCLL